MDKRDKLKDEIIRLTVDLVKEYRGRGPLYVKAYFEEQSILIEVKGYVSSTAKFLLENGGPDQFVEDIERRISHIVSCKLLDGIKMITGCEFEITSVISDFSNDVKTMILRRKSLSEKNTVQ